MLDTTKFDEELKDLIIKVYKHGYKQGYKDRQQLEPSLKAIKKSASMQGKLIDDLVVKLLEGDK